MSTNQMPTQEIHLQLPTSSQVKVSSSETQTVTTVPVTIDGLSNLVQTAAIQIVSQADADQVRLQQQYKCAVQVCNVYIIKNESPKCMYSHNFRTAAPNCMKFGIELVLEERKVLES